MATNSNIILPDKTPCLMVEGITACLDSYQMLDREEKADFFPHLKRLLQYRIRQGTEVAVLNILQDRFEDTKDVALFELLGHAILHHAKVFGRIEPKRALPYLMEVAQGAAGTPLGAKAEACLRPNTTMSANSTPAPR